MIKISAISTNRYYNTFYSNKANVSCPSFKGALNDNSAKRVIDMLKPKITSVKTCEHLQELMPIIRDLTKKWDNVISPADNAIGIKIIPDKYLADFLGKEFANFAAGKNKVLCVAAGDKYGVVENWKKCYEAIAVLLPKKIS